jgi:pimeloyl-ACP methyl ester carboxylesterase
MSVDWKSQQLQVNGIKTQVLRAGQGEPLVFWHGGGTAGGWDFAAPWTEKFTVYLPLHPGFGGSADDASITGIQDYVMHYLDLLDQLQLERFHLVGFSLGGWMAAAFASQHSQRLQRLVLAAPAGLWVRAHPSTDIFRLKPEELPAALAENLAALGPPPDPHDVNVIVEGYRELTTLARVGWQRMYDPKLSRHLHRIKVPTLLVWGEQDRIVPLAQAAEWQRLIPGAQLRSFAPSGHLVLHERAEAVKAVREFLSRQ